MSWIIRVGDDQRVSTDDFTLADLDQVETESGTAWSVASAYRSAKVARAFLRIAYRHAGRDPDDVDSITMRRLKTVFEYVPDEPEPEADGDDAPPLDPSTPDSSPGASSDGGGHRRKRAASG